MVMLLLLVAATGCKKYEINEITGNQPPPDVYVSPIVKESYVNRLHITLLGRKADSLEFQAGLALLGSGAVSQASREALVSSVTADPDYKINLFDIAMKELLQDADTASMRNDRDRYASYIGDSAYIANWNTYQRWVDQLDAILQAPTDLAAGLIDYDALNVRAVSNTFYDEINMGTENFIVSMYQHFLFRYPSDNELEDASTMVDGSESVAFLVAGRTKQDFVQIFFQSDDYYEGRVRDLFLKYLLREPGTTETYNLATQYSADHDYAALQKKILASVEYFTR
jgi:hypothetical protein